MQQCRVLRVARKETSNLHGRQGIWVGFGFGVEWGVRIFAAVFVIGCSNAKGLAAPRHIVQSRILDIYAYMRIYICVCIYAAAATVQQAVQANAAALTMITKRGSGTSKSRPLRCASVSAARNSAAAVALHGNSGGGGGSSSCEWQKVAVGTLHNVMSVMLRQAPLPHPWLNPNMPSGVSRRRESHREAYVSSQRAYLTASEGRLSGPRSCLRGTHAHAMESAL